MARIGILTFQNTLNYGAVLQCYALYRTLEKLGHEPVVIDYRCELVEKNEGLIYSWGHPRSVLRYLRLGHRRKAFDDFKSHLRMTDPCTRGDISDICRDFDFVVVGSDQVWNPRCMGDDPTYFLDFLDSSAKKKSYAASTGGGEIPRTTFDAIGLLNDFSSLLLREKTGTEYVSSVVSSGVVPQTVIDPTLLLTGDEWAEVADDGSAVKRTYLISYLISEREMAVRAAERLAADSACSIIEVSSGNRKPSITTPGVTFITSASPEGFVSLFHGADYAVVSSFHGVCFSVLNHLDFYYSLPYSIAIDDKRNSRVEDLLAALGISHRSVQEYLAGSAESINWALVDNRLAGLREASIAALASSLAIGSAISDSEDSRR